MSDSEADQQLLPKAVAGDRLAMQQLLVTHHDHLIEIVARKLPVDLRRRIAPEDICQDAYISAIRSISTFEATGVDSFFGWLRTIAERKLTDAIRAEHAAKRGRGKVAVQQGQADTSSVVAVVDLLAIHERTPSRSVARREAIVEVQRALEKLPPDHRDVLQYRYVQGLDVPQTAERMARSEGAVRVLCMRALRELGRLMGDPVRFLSTRG